MPFPTRQYPYRKALPDTALAAVADPLTEIAAGSLVRFFLGRDAAAVPMDTAAIDASLQDPFGRIVLAPGPGMPPRQVSAQCASVAK